MILKTDKAFKNVLSLKFIKQIFKASNTKKNFLNYTFNES